MAVLRTFVAIESSEAAIAALARLQARLRSGPGGRAGRWVRPETAHLTIKFLGDVPSETIPAVAAALDRVAAQHAPFALELRGVGCFPNGRRPRVVWAGVWEPQGRLTALQKAVEAALAALGHPAEARPFAAHLTLARVRDGALSAEIEALARSVAGLQAEAAQSLAQMQVTELTLFKSVLHPTGPVYTVLHHARLRG
jgi:2'-5' RNA ligase